MCAELLHKDAVIKVKEDVDIHTRGGNEIIITLRNYLQASKNPVLLKLQGINGFTEIRSDENGKVYRPMPQVSVAVESVPLNPRAELYVEVFKEESV